MLELRVRISWAELVLVDRSLAPPRDFWVGDADCDVSLPCPRTRLIEVSDGRIVVDIGQERVELCEGSRAEREIGGVLVEVEARARVRARFGRVIGGELLPWLAGAGALAAALLGLASFAPVESEQQRLEDQLYLMQHYLSASAERELERDVSSDASGTSTRGIRGGVGSGRDVQGPNATETPRAAALAEAHEFGLIGLVPAASGSLEPQAPLAGFTVDEPLQNGDPFGDALDPQGGEEYDDHGVNPPIDTQRDPLSTFAVDVDTGSYSVARRKLTSGVLPPLASVRAEEFINAFDYGYAGPEHAGDAAPFTVHLDAAPSPFDTGHHLLRVAIQGRRVAAHERPPVHLVYLVDTSGSMDRDDRLGLVKRSLRLLTRSLRAGDTVALQTYAGEVREVLAPTGIDRAARIFTAIDELDARGGTAMASGIENAYRLASRTHVPGEISRVIVLSDGDTNIGPTSADEILALIRDYVRRGITLSTVGFGVGNYRDSMMERLANAGDGNYSYIGDLNDAKRVFAAQAGGLLQVIARDLKVQLEFDPSVVRRYRLLGYENRDVADGDFRNDRVDGGELGAGHAVTAIYDVELWHTNASPVTVHLRHLPALSGDRAEEHSVVMPPERIAPRLSDPAFRFASAVAGFAEILRGSPYALDWKLSSIEALASSALDSRPEREELVTLVQAAAALRSSI